MTKKQTPSLFFSILIHLLLGVILYGLYQISAKVIKPKQKETLISVRLSSYVPPATKKVVIPKKIIQKVVKKPLKKKKVYKKIEKVKQVKKILPKKVPSLEKTHEVVSKKVAVIPSPPVEIPKEQKPIVQTPPISVEKEYIDNHLDTIARLLEDNLYYPRRARKRGIVGVVIVHFEISTDAKVSQLEVLSSPSEILSRAALKTIEDLSGKFPKPKEKLHLKVPIKYELKR